ncbi:MAG: transcription termination factor Rho, partial [Fusobacteriaceae bacterium]
MQNLDKFLLKEINEMVKQLGLDLSGKTKKSEIIKLIEENLPQGYDIGWGSLDILADGYGFLRNTNVGKDIYISASQVKRFKLR